MKKNIIFLLIFWGYFSFAQTLSSSLSQQKINVGEIITMKINVHNLQNKEVFSAQKNALLPFGFENYNDDIQQSSEQYSRTIEFSILEEGNYQIPALEFKVGETILYTIPYHIEVYNSTQQNDINDIKPNEEIDLGLSDYWDIYKNYIIGGIIAVIGLFAFYYIFKNKKPQSTTNKLEKDYQSLALKKLDALQNKNYTEKGEAYIFYTELLDITRDFLTQKYDIPAVFFLTDDLLNFLKETQMATQWQNYMQEIFTRGDLAKFGKYQPTQNVMEQDFEKIKLMITTMKDHI